MKQVIFLLKIIIIGLLIEICLLSGLEGLMVSKTDFVSWLIFSVGIFGLIKFARTYDLKWGSRRNA